MGRKCKTQWYPDIIYAASILIALLLFTSCAVNGTIRSFSDSLDADLDQKLKAIDTHIQNSNFQAASDTNEIVLENVLERFQPGDTVLANYLKQAQIDQALFIKILSDQVQTESLFNRIQQDQIKLQKKQKAINGLEKRVSQLNKKLATLNKQKEDLEEQILQLKQIDLDQKQPAQTLEENAG